MRLKELRGNTTQKELLRVIKAVDSRVDSGLLSKYENNIALPTPTQLDAICSFLGVEALDIYSPSEIYLDAYKPNIGAVTVKKDTCANTYRLTVNLDRVACKWLDKQVLSKCGYVSISHFVRCSVSKLKQQYEKVLLDEQKKAARQKGKRLGK